MHEFVMDNGIPREEYHFFLKNKMKQHCVMGYYYYTNEHRGRADGSTSASGGIFGYHVITTRYSAPPRRSWWQPARPSSKKASTRWGPRATTPSWPVATSNCPWCKRCSPI